MASKNEDTISKSDLDTIIEVNKKAIELQVEVAAQNEKVIEALDEVKSNNELIKKDVEYILKEIQVSKSDIKEYKKEIIEKFENDFDSLKEKISDLDKNQFRIYALLTTGAIAIIIQIIQMIFNWKK